MKGKLDINAIDIQRFASSKERLTKTYNLEELDIPVIYEKPELELGLNSYQLYRDEDVILARQLANIRAAMDCECDYDPRIDIFLGSGIVAEAFGSEIVFVDDNPPWPRPAITNPKEINKFKNLRVEDCNLLRQVLRFCNDIQQKVEYRVPIGVVESTSPFSTAAYIMSSEQLLLACYDSPREVHLLLEMITRLIIEFHKKYLETVKHPAWPGLNFPSVEGLDLGIEIADDTALIQLSPGLYQEFVLPYNSWLSEEFGGICVHSCGDYSHNLDNLLKTPNLRVIHVHSGPKEMDIEKTVEKVNGQCVVFCDSTEVSWKGHFRSYRECMEKYTLPRLKKIKNFKGFILQVGYNFSVEEINENTRWLREELRNFRKRQEVKP